MNIFKDKILEILTKKFDKNAKLIFESSNLLKYLVAKTKSANKGSKSRGSYANIYAIYVLVEDYIRNNFHLEGDYSKYEGAEYTKLLARQRELPFGSKLQNHALNNRLNSEFESYFVDSEIVPITRLADSERYWFNQNLLIVSLGNENVNIAESVMEIIDEYIKVKKESLNNLIDNLKKLRDLNEKNTPKAKEFIFSLIEPNVDARIFEIVSYSILKFFYSDTKIYWGFEYKLETLKEENLKLYKTGRTNANDGGIDFVMKPLGRFFQVTETMDFRKYFLDIDKLQKFPLTFIIKTEDSIEELKRKIKKDATKSYTSEKVVEDYMNCIEELINIPILKDRFSKIQQYNKLSLVLDEIIIQSKLEFNLEDIEKEIENEIE